LRVGNQIAVATRHDRLRVAGATDMKGDCPIALELPKHALEMRQRIL